MRTLWARRTSARAVAVAATLLLVAGCVTAGGLTAPPKASSPSGASPSAIAPEVNCGTSSQWVDYAPYTIASLAASGKVFVVGEVKAIEPAIFNTADGKKPRGFFAKPGTVANAQPNGKIFTPVVVLVDQVLRGETTPGVVRVLIEGGTIGCYTVRVDVAPVVERGGRYVLILEDGLDADGKKLLDLQQMMFAWPVDANDVVQTAEGPMLLASLAAIVAQASPTPAPTP
jgi:hypothetical protein